MFSKNSKKNICNINATERECSMRKASRSPTGYSSLAKSINIKYYLINDPKEYRIFPSATVCIETRTHESNSLNQTNKNQALKLLLSDWPYTISSSRTVSTYNKMTYIITNICRPVWRINSVCVRGLARVGCVEL